MQSSLKISQEMNKVIVLGHSYLSRLAIIRALGEYGYNITVLIVAREKKNVQIDCCSKYVNRVLVCPSFDGYSLVNILLEKCVEKNEKPILIPTSDVTVSMIDDHQDKLKDYFLYPHVNNERGKMVHWMDKSVQKNLARKIGLNVVEYWEIEIKNQHFSIPDHITYPCFVKPQITIRGGKSLFKRCNDKEQLGRFIHEIAQHRDNIKLLIERFLEIDEEYAVVGFSDGENVIISGVIYLEQVSQSHFGVARLGKVLPVDSFQPLIDQFKSYVKTIGFVGLFDIDFLECQGTYYFCELNLRFGGSGDALTKMGVNLPVMLVEKLSTGSVRTFPPKITDQVTFVNERVCIDDWYRGFLSTKDYKYIEVRADFGFLENQNDPKPYLSFLNYRRKLWLKKIAKRLLHRSLN